MRWRKLKEGAGLHVSAFTSTWTGWSDLFHLVTLHWRTAAQSWPKYTWKRRTFIGIRTRKQTNWICCWNGDSDWGLHAVALKGYSSVNDVKIVQYHLRHFYCNLPIQIFPHWHLFYLSFKHHISFLWNRF